MPLLLKVLPLVRFCLVQSCGGGAAAVTEPRLLCCTGILACVDRLRWLRGKKKKSVCKRVCGWVCLCLRICMGVAC